MAKWAFYLLVFLYMCYKAVTAQDEGDGKPFIKIIADPKLVFNDGKSMTIKYNVGEAKAIFCNSSIQPIEWFSPSSIKVAKRSSTNSRVYVEKMSVIRVVPLIIRRIEISDAGNWTCKAGDLSASINVIVAGVYGARVDNSVSVDQIHYGDKGYLEAGTRKTISCKASTKNQRLEWIDPFGNIVKRVTSNRVYAQEQIVSSPRGGRAPGLVLTISQLLASDSGVYQCKSGEQKKSVQVCAIKPSEFVDTAASITTEAGRAITLTCQSKGDPEPRLVWVRDDEELSEGVKHPKYRVNRKYNSQGYESLLTIVSLEPEDQGLYSCVSVQESPMLDNCTHFDLKNVTLLVNYAPSFSNAENIKLVYGSDGEMVKLKCSAKGWPKPVYRWMEDQGATLDEFDKTEIKFLEEPHSAVLTLKAEQDAYGKILKCKATNILGTAEKEFKLLEREKPEKCSNIQVLLVKSNLIHFNVTWNDEILFPVDGFDIQYVESPKSSPNTPDKYFWKKAKQVHKKIYVEEQEDEDNLSGIIVALDGLKPTTNYFVRMRAVNEAGEAQWSDKITVSTNDKEDDIIEEVETETEESENVEKIAEKIAEEINTDNGMFYGIFFAGSILIVAVVCMFAMRLV